MSGISSLPPTPLRIQAGIFIGLGPELYPATISFDPFIFQKFSSFCFLFLPFTFQFFCYYLPLRVFTSLILFQSVPSSLFSVASCQPFFRFTLPPTPQPACIQIAELDPTTTLTDIQQSQIGVTLIVSLASILSPAAFLPLWGGEGEGGGCVRKPYCKGQ